MTTEILLYDKTNSHSVEYGSNIDIGIQVNLLIL